MKKIEISADAMERARTLCDEVETAMQVKTGVKAGAPASPNGRGHGYGRDEPDIIALYGVIVASA